MPASAQVMAPPKPQPGAPVPVTAPPLELTASDGAGLELVSLSAQAVIEDPLAFTELHLVFRNPESRTREGRFRITLPSGATVSRFAMRIGDKWQEGEVVEAQAARVAYEDFLHRRQDPALLEAEAGNEFSARVFPIPPNATKELIVSYSQELRASGQPYRLPLVGLPRLRELAIRALVSKAGAAAAAPASSLGGQRARTETVEVHKSQYKPDRDFEVAAAGGAGPRLGLRNDNLVVARIVPFTDTARRDDVASLLVLVDTSASRALGLSDEIAAVERLLVALRAAGDPAVTIAAFDQDVAPIFTGKASAVGSTLRDRLTQRRALGASDLDRALGWAAGAVAKDRRTRVLLVTDGVATAGETAADKLRGRVRALAPAGVERLDVLAVGGIREDALLARLVTAGLPRDGVVLDAAQPSQALAGRMTRATRSGLKVEVEGAGWVWPSTLDGVQPGDEVLVYADLPASRPFRVKVGGALLPVAGTLAPVERPLLERAWVRARIARLLELRDAPEKTAGLDGDMAEALKKQAIDLSVKYRVLCPFTSLLVLETEQDYARFGIERRALADILTVDGGGIALMHRSDFGAAAADAVWQAQPSADEGAPSFLRSPVMRKGHVTLRARAGKDLDMLASPASDAPRRDAEPMREMRRSASPRMDMSARELAEVSGQGAGPGAVATLGAAMTSSRSAPSAPVAAAASPPVPMAAPRAVSRRAAAVADAGEKKTEVASRASARDVRGALAPAPEVARPVPPPSPPVVAYPATVPVTGALKEILDLVHRGDARGALGRALAWRSRDPGDVLALVALGECWEALGDAAQAARAYGSMIDLFPGRADMRRFAGERLEHVRGAAALALAIDTYRKAVEQRPDHPASHRLLGFALLKAGRPREAFEAIAAGAARRYPDGRFRGVERILSEDLGLAAAAWTRAEPSRADDIRARLSRAGGVPETASSLRFVLNWETDANDVDFHIYDGRGGHAFYSSPQLPSGGELYADVTTGYGPECFTIRNPPRGRAYPYKLQAHYYSRGPMGYGMGKLQIIEHDGHGALHFDERPFVIMQDGAFVDLGTVKGGAAVVAQPAAGTVLAR
ncbi:MAG TPA: VIT domain-containing protein [Polyangia bacterium]